MAPVPEDRGRKITIPEGHDMRVREAIEQSLVQDLTLSMMLGLSVFYKDLTSYDQRLYFRKVYLNKSM